MSEQDTGLRHAVASDVTHDLTHLVVAYKELKSGRGGKGGKVKAPVQHGALARVPPTQVSMPDQMCPNVPIAA